jgi:hypothetical protein
MDVKLEIKTVRSTYTAELTRAVNSEHGRADQHDIYVPKLLRLKNTFITE